MSPGSALLPRALLLALGALAPLALETGADGARGAGSEVESMARFQQRIDALLARALPATVRVVLPDANGSGVIVSDDGLVLTAAHVAQHPGEEAQILFADGQVRTAVTLGSNEARDSALLRIEGAAGLPHVELPPPAPLAPEGWCVALGFPRGGIEGEPAIARLGRLKDVGGQFLLTDCALIGGDSGGPLFDLDGKLVGIHSRIEIDVAANYHVPMRTFRLAWNRLLAGERWSSGGAMLGLRDVSSAEGGARAGGLLVGGPAELAGLREGDVIVGLDGEEVYGADELSRLLMDLLPCQVVTLALLRGEQALSIEVTLGDRGEGPPPDVNVDPEEPRAPLGLGRVADKVRARFEYVTDAHDASVAKILVEGRVRALATVVDADGWLLSKASELEGELTCVLHDGRSLPAHVAARDPLFDLALVRVSATGLAPLAWSRDPVPLGCVVVAAGAAGFPLGVGLVGATPRAITGGEGRLGVVLAMASAPVVVAEVLPDSPADLAGVRVGDRILRIENTDVVSRQEAEDLLRAHLAGDTVRLELERDGTRVLMAPVLAGRIEVEEKGARFRLEGRRSELRGGFPSALQHDVVLAPDECGGPLFDLEGRAVGLNIARAGRVASYAVPADRIDVIVARLQQRALELVSDER